MAIKSSIVTRNVNELADITGNLYKAVHVIGERAKQISSRTKDELNSKLAEFASTVDNLEEVFENREQIEISKFYERMPKPSIVALEEFLEEKIYHRDRDEELEN